jgi:hypothetical protein
MCDTSVYCALYLVGEWCCRGRMSASAEGVAEHMLGIYVVFTGRATCSTHCTSAEQCFSYHVERVVSAYRFYLFANVQSCICRLWKGHVEATSLELLEAEHIAISCPYQAFARSLNKYLQGCPLGDE